MGAPARLPTWLYCLAPYCRWRQYAFLVGEGDAEVAVNVQLEDTNSTGSVDLYLKPEQPAGGGQPGVWREEGVAASGEGKGLSVRQAPSL